MQSSSKAVHGKNIVRKKIEIYCFNRKRTTSDVLLKVDSITLFKSFFCYLMWRLKAIQFSTQVTRYKVMVFFP